jgi:Flp pilus assembly protein TadG
MNNNRRHSERGMTLVVVALSLVALMGIAALCIDLGILYTARTSAQHAADAAALAGAFTFLNPAATRPTAAQNAAIAAGGKNNILGQPVAISANNVTVDTVNRTVTVTVPRTGANGVRTFFARALGINSVGVSVSAKAHASSIAGSSRCVKPVYMPNTILSTQSPAQACTLGQVLFDSSGNLTSWAQSRMDQCTLIRPTSPADITSGGFSAGQFFSLDFGSGANTYRCTWSSCLNNVSCGANQSVIACGNSYPLKTGDMVGPTKQGVGDLTTPTDTWVGPGQYQTPGGTTMDISKQVVVIPVWNNCTQSINSGTNGQTAKVIGFLEMFVAGMTNQNGCGGGGGGSNGSWVKVYSINATGCGSGGTGVGGANGTPPTGPLAIPVQLVKQ